MSGFQRVTHDGKLAAIVLAGHAIIDDTLPPDAQQRVKAKCLYAIEIADRTCPGPYTDAGAERYADSIEHQTVS